MIKYKSLGNTENKHGKFCVCESSVRDDVKGILWIPRIFGSSKGILLILRFNLHLFICIFRCGHCKRLAPDFEKAAAELITNEPPVELIKVINASLNFDCLIYSGMLKFLVFQLKVDCTVEKKTCEKYGVSGYPSLKIFRNGQYSQDYNGGRTADAIIKYMKGQAGPSVVVLSSKKDFDKFTSSDDYVVVGMFLASILFFHYGHIRRWNFSRKCSYISGRFGITLLNKRNIKIKAF